MPLPPPKTKRPRHVTLQAGCRQGVQQEREMQGLRWICHKNTLGKPSASGFAFWSALNKAWQHKISRRSLAEAEEDKPSPGLLPAWGRAGVPMVGAAGSHEAVRQWIWTCIEHHTALPLSYSPLMVKIAGGTSETLRVNSS